MAIAHQLANQLDIAAGLESLASVAGAQQAAQRTIQLLGASASLRARIGVPLPASDQPDYQQRMAAARAQLDETTYASAYAQGYAMTPDQAVVVALARHSGIAADARFVTNAVHKSPPAHLPRRSVHQS